MFDRVGRQVDRFQEPQEPQEPVGRTSQRRGTYMGMYTQVHANQLRKMHATTSSRNMVGKALPPRAGDGGMAKLDDAMCGVDPTADGGKVRGGLGGGRLARFRKRKQERRVLLEKFLALDGARKGFAPRVPRQ